MGSTSFGVAREKLAQASEALREHGIDTWLVVSREGTDPAMPLLIGARSVHTAMIFIDPAGEHTVVASRSDAAHFEESRLFTRVLVYDEDLSTVFLAEYHRRAPRTVALNISEDDHLCDGLTRGLYLSLSDMLGAQRLAAVECSSRAMLSRVRAVKTHGEVTRIGRAVECTCDIFDEVAGRIGCGMSEIEIGGLFVEAMDSRGVVNGISHAMTPPLVCLVRAGLAHREPGAHRSVPGDMMVVDFSVEVDGYVSDIARTFYFLKTGETAPPEEVQRAFDTTVAAVHRVIRTIRPGMAGYEVDEVGRRVVEEAGYPTIRHSVGHQTGREVHDGGTILGLKRTPRRPAVEGIVEPGEVYAIEPTVIQDGGLPSCIVEENVLIEEDAVRVLSRPQTALYLIPPPESHR